MPSTLRPAMNRLETQRAAEVETEVYPAPRYAWYVVALLTLAYVFSFIDRQILNLLVGPIQRDLGIGDKQMSLLMGASFAVFYTFFGIPLGRLADTWSRRWLVVLGIAFWSLMTAGCGLAHKFWQLALARMGVGVGEAALSPAAYSLIGLGLGPTIVATLTQDVFQDKNAVHLSLLVAGVSAQVCAAVLLWRGLKHYRRSLDYLNAWSRTNA